MLMKHTHVNEDESQTQALGNDLQNGSKLVQRQHPDHRSSLNDTRSLYSTVLVKKTAESCISSQVGRDFWNHVDTQGSRISSKASSEEINDDYFSPTQEVYYKTIYLEETSAPEEQIQSPDGPMRCRLIGKGSLGNVYLTEYDTSQPSVVVKKLILQRDPKHADYIDNNKIKEI